MSAALEMQFTTTFKTVVETDMCDRLGHMNIQHYARLFSDAAFWIMRAIGFEDGASGFDHLALVAVRMEVDYIKEIKAGTVVQITSATEIVSDRRTRFVHRLYDARQDILFAQAVVTSVCIDLESRKSCSLPPSIQAAVEKFVNDEKIINGGSL
jgi:acyl-CoA thioester hydrolase